MFSGNNVVPWHGLGKVVSGLLTAQEAMDAAHLGWRVGAVPVVVNGKELSLDDFQGIIREDTGDCLGITKGRYEIIQNKDCFDFLDILAGEGELKYETAGALRGGKQVWMMAKYNGGIKINGDQHEQWLLCVTSHDSSYSLMVQWVTTRVVCANTLSIALKGAKNQVKIRHTESWQEKSAQAKQVLGLTEDYFKAMQDKLAGLNEQPMTEEDMSAFATLMFPAKDEHKVPTKTSNMRWGVERLFNRGDETGTYGKSRWDALNAVTDYVDHHQNLRGENASRLETALLTGGAQLKQKAYDLLTGEDLMLQLMVAKPYIPSVPNTTSEDFKRLVGN